MNAPGGGGGKPSQSSSSRQQRICGLTMPHLVLTLLASVLSYYGGTLHATHVCLSGIEAAAAAAAATAAEAAAGAGDALKEAPAAAAAASASGSASFAAERFPRTLSGLAAGAARTSKSSFLQKYDFGTPADDSGKAQPRKDADVLILYSRDGAFPDVDDDTRRRMTHEAPLDVAGVTDGGDGGVGIPLIESASDATTNCNEMNVLLIDNPDGQPQCLALVNNYQSYHVQRWMRVAEKDGIKPELPLRLVSRGYNAGGIRSYKSPREEDIRGHWEMLRTYLNSLDDVLSELTPIAQSVANQDNVIIVMTCNFGQSELLMNFACAARARGFELSNVLVFPTDRETEALARGLGLTAYYDARNFESMPSKEAGRYGDKRFVAMMYAKVVCVQLVVSLGYDVLFQDVDLVWYQNPLEWFRSHKDDGATPGYPWDLYFQDDGAHTVRYAPFSANSGFYYVRNNERTRYLFASLLYVGDLIRRTESHQQALIALLNEHSSLYGLRVKVLNREMEEFPGGWNFHRKNKQYMKRVMKGEITPYIFHMSWTTNKRNKVKFLQQMGEWWVNEERCVQRKSEEILPGDKAGEKGGLVAPCCLKEASFTCHYRDKPSLKSCKDSPPIDKGGRSFW